MVGKDTSGWSHTNLPVAALTGFFYGWVELNLHSSKHTKNEKQRHLFCLKKLTRDSAIKWIRMMVQKGTFVCLPCVRVLGFCFFLSRVIATHAQTHQVHMSLCMYM